VNIMYDESLIEERVDRLETILGEFIVSTSSSLNRLSKEMREFKNEMREDMREFKNEMREFKNEIRQDRKAMNKQWGELANKMGTLTEDIVVPAVRPAIKRYFNQELIDFMVKRKRKIKASGLEGEFDVIAVSEDKVFVVEVKSSPDENYLNEFVKKMDRFVTLFPKYADKRLIPVFAGLRFGTNIIELASSRKVYVMAYREWDYMDILNFEKIDRAS
jgi:hypothetical protein